MQFVECLDALVLEIRQPMPILIPNAHRDISFISKVRVSVPAHEFFGVPVDGILV